MLFQIKLAEKRLVSLFKQKKYCFYHICFRKLKSEDGIGYRKKTGNLPLSFSPLGVENKLLFLKLNFLKECSSDCALVSLAIHLNSHTVKMVGQHCILMTVLLMRSARDYSINKIRIAAMYK